MTRDEAIIKIKKCMALSKSAEPAEAAAALRQAQKLMSMFAVSEQALSFADVKEERVRAASQGQARWENMLAHKICDAFGCESYMVREAKLTPYMEIKRITYYVFVGLEAAPVLAAYAFDVLTRQCHRARAAHIKLQPKRCKPATKTARGDEFAVGWVLAASAAVERFAQPQRNEELLLAYMGERHPDLKSSKPRNTTKGKNVQGHRLAGWQEGKNAQLHHGVGQQTFAQIGG